MVCDSALGQPKPLCQIHRSGLRFIVPLKTSTGCRFDGHPVSPSKFPAVSCAESRPLRTTASRGRDCRAPADSALAFNRSHASGVLRAHVCFGDKETLRVSVFEPFRASQFSRERAQAVAIEPRWTADPLCRRSPPIVRRGVERPDRHDAQRRLCSRPARPHTDDWVSRRGELHPPALAEPDMNLSAHPAPIVQPSGRAPNRQWANRPGSRL